MSKQWWVTRLRSSGELGWQLVFNDKPSGLDFRGKVDVVAKLDGEQEADGFIAGAEWHRGAVCSKKFGKWA